MKFKTTGVGADVNILANDHYVAVSYDCSDLTPDDEGIIVAGTIVDGVGILLSDVYPEENPNGTVVIHGFINRDKLPEAPADESAFPQLTFLPIETE
ncbi:MAG: hypothetical protein LUD81_10575 [Clostridiales bacterium]|nr:hypothetical protein [Clostridiales bacterium]